MMWLQPDGSHTFTNHPDNVRHQNCVVDDYEADCLQHGIVAEGRGAVMALMNDTPSGMPYLLITWGTLSRAFYNCVAKFPDHPMVLASLEAGLENVYIFHTRTPSDTYGRNPFVGTTEKQ